MNTPQTHAPLSVIPLHPLDIMQELRPIYPIWPTSRPGPMRKQTPPGMRPINPWRSDQLVYKTET